MRNLKRVLSLALALVMVLGLMVIGASAASADFPDAAEIDYTEAVDVVSGLGIMIGDDKGNFNPDQILTREMAAKVICYTLIGAENAEKLGKNTQIFDDVAAGRWSAGYIAYCANLGILVGDGNGLFRPEDNLTGVQFGKMLLVAAGYDAETQGYVGSDWATNIGTDMIATGLDLKGILMSDNLTREQAAQMLLQAMDIDTVEYVTGNVVGLIGPYTTGDTFAEKYFPKLEKIEGVVTANEYADLYDDEPLKAGKTAIDGKVYTGSTELTDIGESRVGWANNGKILYLADSGKNTVFSTGAATKLDAKFEKANGIDKDTEYFVNFEDESEVKYETDIRIVYSTTGYDADKKIVKAGDELSTTAYKEIKAIFDSDDLTTGFVVVGTKYNAATAHADDISNTITFKKFVSEYLTENSSKVTTFDDSENGEWLKVVDNNGDGKADYVFKTEFAMAKITAISKKGVYTLTGLATTDKPSIEVTTIDTATETIVTSDELAVGNIVLYTVIDGVYYVDVAEVAVETIDKKGISTKNETVTCDGTVYGQSHIGYSDVMYSDITAADTGVSYDFYLDHFSYVRLYEESAWSNGFVLLTDGYYETDRRTDLYKAEIWNVEAEDYEDVVVLDGKAGTAKDADNFIKSAVIGSDDEGTWNRLYTADDVYGSVTSTFTTNIAGYSASDDGYTLIKIGNNAVSNKVLYNVEELKLTATTKLTDKTLTSDYDSGKVQATTDTVYYLVVGAGNKQTITSWTGYANAPKGAALANGAKAYAVTVASTVPAATYDVAEIIVFETAAANPYDLYFVYDETNYDAITIGYDADEEGYVDDLYVEVKDVDDVDPINFYNIYANGTVNVIDEDFADENIYAATVETAYRDVNRRDYVRANVEGVARDKEFYEDQTTVYVVNETVRGYTVSVAEDKIDINDKLILVTDAKGNIEYIINATQSTNRTGGELTVLTTGLWKDIKDDANRAPAASDNLYSVTVKGVAATATGEGSGTAADPFIYEAGLTQAEIDESSSKKWIVVEAANHYDPVKITWADGVSNAKTGEGSAEDSQTGSISTGHEWIVVCDGVYYDVKVKLVKTAAELLTEASAGDTVVLPAGEYTLPTIDKNITIDGSEGAVITGPISVAASVTDVTIKNCTIELDSVSDYISFVTHAGAQRVVISGNTFIANAAGTCSAIYIDAMADCMYEITGNTFVGDFDEGAVDIDMSYGTSVVTVTGNDFSEVTGAHIHIWNVKWPNLTTDVDNADIALKTHP